MTQRLGLYFPATLVLVLCLVLALKPRRTLASQFAGPESDSAAAVVEHVSGPAFESGIPLHPGPYASMMTTDGVEKVYTTFRSMDERIRAAVHWTDDSEAKFGCEPPSSGLIHRIQGDGMSWALVVNRGNCTFERKLMVAQGAGAAALLVLNSKTLLYKNTTLKTLDDVCTVYAHHNPSSGEIVCDSGYDVCSQASELEFRLSEADLSTKTCCIDNSRSIGKQRHLGQFGASNMTIPFLFVSIADGAVLRKALNAVDGISGPLIVDIYPRGGGVDGSVFLTLCTGVFAAFMSSYFSARKERRWARRRFWLPLGSDFMRGKANRDRLRREAERDADNEALQQKITWRHAVAMLICSATILIGLYFLIKAGFEALILTMQIIYIYAATVALFRLIFYPVIDDYTGLKSLSKTLRCCCDSLCPSICPRYVPLDSGLAFALSFVVALTWYFSRHAGWNFLLMNAIGICVCMTVTSTLRISSARVAAVLLGLFFFYDIFMVFITPAIFGDSVMLEVATNGGKNAGSTSVRNGSHSNSGSETVVAAECNRVLGENMPMLYMYPRLSGWPSGSSMLGFGDIIFPSILLSYALRYDYSTRGRACCPFLTRCCEGSRPETREQPKMTGIPYFGLLMFGYGVGLALAFVANYLEITINGVRGQPALLYLVPCTLGPLIALSYVQGELQELWNGFDDDLASATASQVVSDYAEKLANGGDSDVELAEEHGDAGTRSEKNGHLVVEDAENIRCSLISHASNTPADDVEDQDTR